MPEDDHKITTIKLPTQDFQNLQRVQNGGFSGKDPFWDKQSGEDGFITWVLRMAYYLIRRGEFYPLLEEVKKDFKKES